MYYKISPKNNLLSTLLGNVDQLDVSYILQSDNNTSYSSILFCLNSELLDILYKYDVYSPAYTQDQTESGESICLDANLNILNNDVVKINITQKFVRCFSYYKESNTSCNTNCSNSSITTDYISIYPKLFLDFENDQLTTLLTPSERIALGNSKLYSVEFTTKEGHWLPALNNIASRSVKCPDNILLHTFVDHHVHYPQTIYELKYNNNIYSIPLWYDEKSGEDKYSSYAKTFNIINDSTVIMDFEFYIKLNNVEYLIDSNDININYHINPITDQTINSVGNYTLILYEKIDSNKFKVGTILYIKNIYTEETIAIVRILDINNNGIVLNNLYSSFTGVYNITGMDSIEIYKVKTLENYNIIQNRSLFLLELINKNLLAITDLVFEDDDFSLINTLG